MKQEKIKHKVSGEVFTICYRVVSLPVRFEPQGRRIRRAWVAK